VTDGNIPVQDGSGLGAHPGFLSLALTALPTNRRQDQPLCGEERLLGSRNEPQPFLQGIDQSGVREWNFFAH